MPQVGDVLRGLTGAEFCSDVQVANYYTDRNLELLRHYIFTSQAPSPKKSSVDLLRALCEACAPGAAENRFIVIATYGHGKSHFALALANFFGKGFRSEESAAVLGAIHHAVPDDDMGVFGYIEDFKKQHQPYLVLLLRGDEPSGLPTKFHRALKEALLHDQSEEGDSDLPFWFKGAEDFLVNINPDRRAQANDFLARHQLDLDSLLGRVRECDASTRDICVALSRELYKIEPNFDAGVSLRDAVSSIASSKCGLGRPYAGLLILFDEFSQFVADYCSSSVPGSPLQDLLNGVANARERAVFVAFSQHDPDEVARRSSQGDKLSNVLKELDRLPKTRRYQLHSSLEEVLESYLRKRDDVWQVVLDNDLSFSKQLDEATTKALHAFRKRYVEDLKWGDTERFHSLVTLGCYPLHPFTTSLLCSVELQATTSTRSLLGFVQDSIEAKAKEPVAGEAGPNWVRAISLVDYFNEMLGEDNWRPYRAAVSRLSQPDEPEPIEVLQAMLLLDAGKVSVSLGYAKTVAEVAGVSTSDATRILDQLTERSVIRRDSVTANYKIAPTGWGDKGEKIAQDKVQQVKLDVGTLENLRDDLGKLGLGHVELPVHWGHSADWHVQQILVGRDILTKEYLSGVLRRHISWTLDATVKEKPRGLAVWLIARDEQDVEWYRNGLADLIMDVIGNGSVPLVMMRPNAPSTTLIERLKRYAGLKSFTAQERSEAELSWHRDATEQARKLLERAVAGFKSDCTNEVPVAFRAQLAAVKPNNLDGVLTEVIKMAYPYGPGRWFDQYTLTQGKLVEAVSAVCSALIRTGKLEPSLLGTKPIAGQAASLYMRGAWKVLDATNRAVRPPTSSPVYKAWAELDGRFKAGEPSCNVRPVLEGLLNQPFGYDWNTLALLFASWWACHRYNLQVTGAWASIGALTKPRDLLQAVSGCSIRRREDPTGEIEQIIKDIGAGGQRSQMEAQGQLKALNEFLQRDDVDHAFSERIREASKRIEEGLDCARRYDAEAKTILLESERASFQQTLSSLSRIVTLPIVSFVAPEQPTPDQIKVMVRERVEQQVENFCSTYGRLLKLEDYTSNLGQLQMAEKLLNKPALATALQKIKGTIAALKQARQSLEDQRQRESKKREQEALINSLSSHGTVCDLRSGLAQFNEMDPTPEVVLALEQKRAEIAKELDRLVTFAQSLGSLLDLAMDRSAVSNLRDNALRSQSAFDDAENGSLLQQAITRCEALATFFAELEKVQQRPRFRPEDFARDTDEVQSLIATNAEHLSDGQRAAAERVVAALADILTAERKRVLQRIEGYKQELAHGATPEKLQGDLERAASDWEFLPEDAAASLNGLRTELDNRIELARAKREEEARLSTERQFQERLIRSLSTRGPISGLKNALRTLDEMTPQPELKPLWDKTHDAVARELERLANLPKALNAKLDQATDRLSIEVCCAEAMQAGNLCDEAEALQAIQYVPARCEAVGDYFEQIEKTRHLDRSTPESFATGTTAIKQLVAEKTEYLSDAQRAVAEKEVAKLHSALSEKQEQARKVLARLQGEVQRKQPVSKIQRDLDTTSWAFLPVGARDSLEKLRSEVQACIDNDEAQQVEVHFMKIREPELRRKCLEALERLVEEKV